MYPVLEISRHVNLAGFSQALRRKRIPHRIVEQGEKQVVLIHTRDAAEVRALFEQHQAGSLEVPEIEPQIDPTFALLTRDILLAPFIVTLLVANVLIHWLTGGLASLSPDSFSGSLTLVEFLRIGGRVIFSDVGHTLASGQYWRLFTPMLLHGGLLHLVFNLLWVWEVGRRIERLHGGLFIFGMVMATSLAANLTQYLMYGPSLFGGMSGVVYGLFGFAVVWRALVPTRDIGFPPQLYVAVILFMMLGFTDMFSRWGLHLANGAHLGGFICGCLLGVMTAFTVTFRRNS